MITLVFVRRRIVNHSRTLLIRRNDIGTESRVEFILKITIWGFPKIRGTFLGVPIIRTVVFLRLYWGSPILGNYHIFNSPQATCSQHHQGFQPTSRHTRCHTECISDLLFEVHNPFPMPSRVRLFVKVDGFAPRFLIIFSVAGVVIRALPNPYSALSPTFLYQASTVR